MDRQTLLHLISGGESSTVEFKREVERPERLAREVVGLANGRGGHVLIGVNDDQSIGGVTLSPGYEEWVAQVGAETISPPLRLNCQAVDLDGRTVLVVEVPSGPDKPYAVKQGQHKSTVYARYGSTTRPASREAIRRLYQNGGELIYDTLVVQGATLSDLDESKLERYFWQETGQRLDDLPLPLETVLENLKVLGKKNGETLATIAGLLIFGRDPARWLPQAELALARFEGRELGGDWIDRLEIRDTLPQSIDAALAFVRRNARLSSRVVGLKREDLSDYLQAVVREAVSNAMTHRDYSLWGANVRLFMFDDRIQVRSPGGLPGGLTVERLPFGAQYSRNPTIFFFLKSLGYGDRYGTGIPRMIKLCREEGIRQPAFQEFENEFVVTIYARE
jgi:ATP-dependent DNA helicase RecG